MLESLRFSPKISARLIQESTGQTGLKRLIENSSSFSLSITLFLSQNPMLLSSFKELVEAVQNVPRPRLNKV
jgi:hypothetical protein